MAEPISTLRLRAGGTVAADSTAFTAIDFETTGLHPGHIVELAAVRTRADGTVLGEMSTLINPGPGIHPGPVHVHRITRDQLDHAPMLAEVFGEFLELCRGSVIVAHNLPFEKRFLAAELRRLGLVLPASPGVCTLSASKAALRLPNHRLSTVASALGMGEFDAHTALADARVCAGVVATLVTGHGLAFTERPTLPELPRLRVTRRTVPRAAAPAPATAGWVADLVDRIPAAPTEGADTADRPLHEEYQELLAVALADHHLSAAEATELAGLAAEAGMSARDVHRVHTEFAAAMRVTAEADGVVTAAEERALRAVATALDVPETLRGLCSGTRPRSGTTRVLVLGGGSEADELRSAVLSAGIQLAKKLTASVTHLAAGAEVPPDEPRRGRARELGATVLDLAAAYPALGLTRAPRPSPISRTVPVPAPVSTEPYAPAPEPYAPPVVPAGVTAGARWGGRALMALGLLLMFIAVTSMFAGAPLPGGLFLGVFGVGALVGGWWLGEPRVVSAGPVSEGVGSGSRSG